MWKGLWKLKCPSKIKHFFWRLAHNSHPLRCNLIRRGMKIESNCPVCDCVGEDGAHLFFKCSLAKKIWRHLGLENERAALAVLPRADSAAEWILNLQEQKRELSVITLWFIWSERNRIREENRRNPPEVIARQIEYYMHETVQYSMETCSKGAQVKKKWKRPPPDVLKLNTDGSFLPSDMAGSWGFVIRDNEGEAVMAGRGRIDNLLDAFHAELVACLHGVQQAADMGVGRLILETDSQEVVKAMNSTAYDHSSVAFLVEEIKFLVSVNFSSFVCSHVGRSCNEAAHLLARLGYGCIEGEDIISISLPDVVSVIVANDLLANE